MLTVFGAIEAAFVFPVPSLPRAGDTVRSEGGRIEPGGKAANQAVAAARDGARVRLVGAVGRDAAADAALAGLAHAGVGLRDVARVDAATGRAAVCVEPDGHAFVVVERGANRLARAAHVPESALGARSTLLLQQDAEPAETAELVLRARGRGGRVILDVGPVGELDADALRAAHLLVGNNHELAWLGERLGTGANAASIQAALGVPVVRMMGPQGAEAFSDAGFLHMPALPVRMRDTTTAGDCFVGVLAGALSRGASLRDALRRGAVAAALSAAALGGWSAMPNAAAVEAALRRAPEPTSRQEEVPD